MNVLKKFTGARIKLLMLLTLFDYLLKIKTYINNNLETLWKIFDFRNFSFMKQRCFTYLIFV